MTMEASRPYRPRVSKETRRLLTTAVLAIVVLWLLARSRFPYRPATPNPMTPVLSQLTGGLALDDLAAEMSQLRPRLDSSLRVLDLPRVPESLPALRIREDVALVLVPRESPPEDERTVLAWDPASGLTLVRVAGTPLVPAPPWIPRGPQQPRFLAATDILGRRIALRPAFMGGIEPIESPIWPGPIWGVPRGADLEPGVFVFTSAGELAGLVVAHGSGLAIVPGETLLAEADRLLARKGRPGGGIGVHVQSLTPALSAATGAEAGVLVSWIDADSVVEGKLSIGDVIETMDGHPVASAQHWNARVARLLAGDTLSLHVRRKGTHQELQVVVPAQAAPSASQALGLTMQRGAPGGARVVGVDPGSVAARAGLLEGDVITVMGGVAVPTPGQVRQAFAAAPAGRPVLIAVTRGRAHLVMTLSK